MKRKISKSKKTVEMTILTKTIVLYTRAFNGLDHCVIGFNVFEGIQTSSLMISTTFQSIISIHHKKNISL